MTAKKLTYLVRNLSIAVGIILVWRGIWVLLDLLDLWLFGNNHIVTAILGIVLGVVILYLPDHELKSLERL